MKHAIAAGALVITAAVLAVSVAPHAPANVNVPGARCR